MKSVDVTGPVMEKVVRWERRRIVRWIAGFVGVMVAVGVIGVIAFGVTYSIIVRRQSLDLLDLFREDWEIIADYWQDTVYVFFEELPLPWILTAAVSAGILAALFWKSRRKRMIIRTKLGELKKYSDGHHHG